MVATSPVRQPVDERVMGAGTTVRFVVLLVLLVVSSSRMMLVVAGGLGLYGSDSLAGWGCALASGVDPNRGADQAAMISKLHQASALKACSIHYELPPWWTPLVWPVVLLALASALFFGLSAWKARRSQVVALDTVDRDGDLRRLLGELAAVASLPRVPRVVVDPAAVASTGAVVFGRNRRPTVCLHGGLLALRTTDPEGFRAVVLHEFAHIRNGDITLTYTTVAVWRVFLAFVLLPFAAWRITTLPEALRSPLWPGYAPGATRDLLLAVFMAMLVYLARSDVLRSREVYADLAAARWGADPRGWAVAAPDPPTGKLRQALGAFVELWRTHPRWDMRRNALDDPAALFGVRALPMFLTGAAVTLINGHVWPYLKQYDLTGWWVDEAVALAAAALAAGAAGIALWRAVAHALLTARPVPSGVRAGLWLGAGMALGEVVSGQQVIYAWLPAQPVFFVCVVLAGAVFTWWTARCALLWITRWQGRTIRPAMLLGLAAACLVLSSWIAWWEGGGALLVVGLPFNPEGIRHGLEQEWGQAGDHPAVLSAIAVAIPAVASVTRVPLLLVAVAALWVLPLLAWAVRPGTTAPRWARSAVSQGGDVAEDLAEPFGQAPPPLRRVLLLGLLGGVLCWAAIAAVRAYMHTWPPAPEQRGALYEAVYLAWVLVALAAATATTAAVVGALTRRYRLLITLIATQIAALVGYAGAFVLLVSERSTQIVPGVGILLAPTLVLATIAAIIMTAAVSAFRRPRKPTAQPPSPSRPPRTNGALAARRVCVGVLCLVALGIATPQALSSPPGPEETPDAAVSQLVEPVHATPVPAQIRQMQAVAWKRYGGTDLLRRFNDGTGSLVTLLQQHMGNDIDQMRVRPLCGAIGQTARDAGDYFDVPDPPAQQLWRTLITQAGKADQSCEHALERRNNDLLDAAVLWSEQATDTAKAVNARLDAILRGDGRADNPPAPAQVPRLQPGAWRSHGGADLLHSFSDNAGRLFAYLGQPDGQIDMTSIRRLCGAIDRTASEASDYFRVSDPPTQQLWQTFIAQTRKASQDCQQALTRTDNGLFSTSLHEIEQATITTKSIETRIDTILRDGG